jgi:hypothetical protein
MRVRLLEGCRVSLDGSASEWYAKGQILDLPPATAQGLVRDGLAEEPRAEAPPVEELPKVEAPEDLPPAEVPKLTVATTRKREYR